jgi:RNA polymerase sigma-70 factor, ECF subfamily
MTDARQRSASESSPTGGGDGRDEGAPWWEAYRAYLRIVVESQLDPRLRAKADLSGVVQLTLWEAHRSPEIERIAPGERLAWLRRVLANNLADEVRKYRSEKRDPRRELPQLAAADDSFDQLAGLVADVSSPSAPLRRDEQAVRLAQALDRLPPAQREALVLQHWHRWDLATIAEHLGRTKMAVAGLLKRGLRQLRDELRDGD